jgi:hypothetical protein
MAINPQKRDNLLLEATAYSRRIQIVLHNASFRGIKIGELFAGVRPDGRWSLYFDESPVIQFDQQEALRRVYVAEKKLAAADGRLVELTRPHQGGKVQYEPQLLGESNQYQLLSELKELMDRTYQSLNQSDTIPGYCPIVGVVPSHDQQLYQNLLSFLSRRKVELKIAASL